MIRWLRWLLGGPAVTFTMHLRGFRDTIGPYHVREGDRIDLNDDKGLWFATVLIGDPAKLARQRAEGKLLPLPPEVLTPDPE